jgi:hypothetical protein
MEEKDDKDVIMNGINPQTGKRMGKFLWMENSSERENYIEELRRKVTDGFFTSDSVIGSIVDELAPAISDSIEVEPVL